MRTPARSILFSAMAIALLLAQLAYCQIRKPVKWNFSASPVGESEALLVFTATIDPGWHIYSQFIAKDGPFPTNFTFTPSGEYSRLDGVKETSIAVKKYEPVFDMDVVWFERTAVFIQKVTLHGPSTTIKGKVEFMACTREECLTPETVTFNLEATAEKPVKKTQEQHVDSPPPAGKKPAVKKVQQKDKPVPVDSFGVQAAAEKVDKDFAAVQRDTVSAQAEVPAGETVRIPIPKQKASLWGIFIGGVLGGLAALFMPCIFPMLPFTISFFTRKAGNAVSSALLYGLSIVVIYVGLGLLITFIFGSDALNALSTNGIFNFFFFALLVVFGASMMGAFELSVPCAWVNKADAQSDRGGLIGIFFMAATLALVSFSCTAPIVGTLLVEATTVKNYLAPAIGMFGFSVALATPFTLFALFPKWINALPKSGGWLNTFKVTLGFLELALALKFLSNVDLAYHWNWFDREVFLVVWIIIFGVLGLYLLGKLTLKHDSKLEYMPISRLFVAMLTLAFAFYMIPGLWGAPLNAIAAFLPPQHTQDFDLYSRTLSSGAAPATVVSHAPKKYGDLFHAPYGLNAFFDYDEGLAYAKKMSKPLMIDFTGHACVNCRKMEATVWADPRVLNRLQHDYVLIQLYVDDKTELPLTEQAVSEYNGKQLVTIGNKWSDFQAALFNTNSQPWYVLLGHDGRLLTVPQGADYNAQNFTVFLDNGLKEFNNE